MGWRSPVTFCSSTRSADPTWAARPPHGRRCCGARWSTPAPTGPAICWSCRPTTRGRRSAGRIARSPRGSTSSAPPTPPPRSRASRSSATGWSATRAPRRRATARSSSPTSASRRCPTPTPSWWSSAPISAPCPAQPSPLPHQPGPTFTDITSSRTLVSTHRCASRCAPRVSHASSTGAAAMRAALLRAVSSVVLALPIGGALAAQGWIEPIRPVPGGGLIERVRSEVQIGVTGRVARVTVEEWFRNGGATVGEGTYIYPLAGEAVFSSFSLWQGEQELRGETMDASQARAIYESIVRRRRDPALIELAGHGMVRARVFPINPGDTRKVTLRYTQLLDRVGDAWRLRYARSAGSSAPRSLRVTVDSASRFGEPYSPTHGVHTSRRGDGLDVTVTDSTGPSDVELFLPLARGIVGTSLMTHHPAGEDGYFMLLLAPGRAAQATVVPRDVVMVLDISGSMSGENLAQAKAALTQLVGTLRTGDRFRLIAFSNSVRRFREDWTAVTADARRDAGQWIEGLDANGGTNIAGALGEAFSHAPAEGS